MSMKINTATSLISEPLFPKYTMTGKIEVTDEHVEHILSEIQSISLHKYNWGLSGWNEDNYETWNMTPMLQKFAHLILHQVYDGVVSQYGLQSTGSSIIIDGKRFTLDVRRCFPLVLNPGHDYPYNLHPSAFISIVWLKTSPEGHKVYCRNSVRGPLDSNMRFWYPEPKQNIIIPGSQQWGISSGNDNSRNVAVVSHIKMIPAKF